MLRPTLTVLAACLVATTLAARQLPSAASSRALSALELERFDLVDGDVQRLSVPDEAASCLVDVRLGARDVTLKLWPHDVRSADFRLLVEDESGVHQLPTPASVTLRGRILGEPDSRVAGALWGGKLHAYLVEDVNAPEVWCVQPLDEFGPASPWHVVYHESQVADVPGACGVDTSGVVSHVAPRRQFVGGAEPIKVCEIACDADVQYYNLLGQSVVNVQNDITNVINNCDFIYVRDVQITYDLTTILVRTAEPDPYTSSDPGSLLGQFRSHWNSQQGGIQRDIAHLFTGRDLDGSVIGIAWLGVICTSSNPYGLSQSRYTGNSALRTGLTAHELGHNWSAPHCNDQGGCAIMCSGNGGCGGPGNFGPTSTGFILSHKATRPCLSDPFPPTLTAAVPNVVDAYLGDPISLTGTNLAGVSAIDVAGQVLSPAFENVQIVDDTEIEVRLVIAPALGTLPVFVTNLAGSSNSLSIGVVPTDPPKLGGTFTTVLGQNVTYTIGSDPGEAWFLFVALDDPTTFPFQGSDILIASFDTGLSGTLTGVGVAQATVSPSDPGLAGRTAYLHALLLGPGGFGGATNVVATTFFQ